MRMRDMLPLGTGEVSPFSSVINNGADIRNDIGQSDLDSSNSQIRALILRSSLVRLPL